MLRYFILVFLSVILVACQSLPRIAYLPPLEDVQQYQIKDLSSARNSLLIVEPVAQQEWRFVWVDSLGAPLARQILQHGEWRNDGFLPPNGEARQLFTVVYAYIMQQKNQVLSSEFEGVSIRQLGTDHVELMFDEQIWQLKELNREQ